MRRPSTPLATLLGLAVLAAACGDNPDVDPDDMAVDDEAAPALPESSTPSGEVAESTESALDVAMYEGRSYLTDGQGMAVYLLEGESAGEAACTDAACIGEWPPLLTTSGTPDAAAPELDEQLIGTVQRTDGTLQVTYAGHPLYHYHDDTARGDTHGQDVHDDWGEWYLVTPEGEPLER